MAAVKRAVGVPVIVNGDIVDAATRARGAGAVRRGRRDDRARRARAAVAAREIAAALAAGAAGAAERRGAGAIWWPSTTRRCSASMGATSGVRVARKHLGWYLDGVAGGAALRAAADAR